MPTCAARETQKECRDQHVMHLISRGLCLTARSTFHHDPARSTLKYPSTRDQHNSHLLRETKPASMQANDRT